MNDMKHIILLCGAVLMLSSCSSILPKGEPAPRLYTLNAVSSQQSGDIQPLPVSLKIIKPQVAPGLDTERIALRQNDNQIDYYADVKWAADASTMIQSVLVENFEATHRLKAVSNDLVTLKNDYTLLVDIRDFQVDYKSARQPQAHIRMTVTLVNASGNDVIRTLSYEQVEKIADENMTSITKAFDKAQQAIMQKLVPDVLAGLRSQSAVKPQAKK